MVPPGHPLTAIARPTLADIAQYPIITYDNGLTGRSRIDEAFTQAGIAPEIVLTAMDADVIKTYVVAGLGIGIIASVAFDAEEDRKLVSVSAEHLFASNMTRVAVRKGAYLRNFSVAFIEMFAPHLNRRLITAPQEEHSELSAETVDA